MAYEQSIASAAVNYHTSRMVPRISRMESSRFYFAGADGIARNVWADEGVAGLVVLRDVVATISLVANQLSGAACFST